MVKFFTNFEGMIIYTDEYQEEGKVLTGHKDTGASFIVMNGKDVEKLMDSITQRERKEILDEIIN